jgi:uncharacterized protein YcbX
LTTAAASDAQLMNVTSLHVYPVKSLGGDAVSTADVEPWGLRDDRRWIVLQPDGRVVTAREEHRLLAITALPTVGGIRLTTRDGQSIDIPRPIQGELIAASISRLQSVRSAGHEADAWLSEVLGSRVRLAWLDDPRRRSVSLTHGGVEGDPLTLADAGPLLLASTKSLDRLNEWIRRDAGARGEVAPDAMVMQRFRPNVVIAGAPEAFEEDDWRTVRIGDVEFRFAEQCDRCVMTTLDPQTLVGGKEPLRTLAKYRQRDHKTWFGVRVVPTRTGAISVGDPVQVVSRSSQSVPTRGRPRRGQGAAACPG